MLRNQRYNETKFLVALRNRLFQRDFWRAKNRRILSMVQALVELDENTNRVLNIVKAKLNLKDKGEAIQYVVSEYIEMENEPELRPEFIERMKKIQKERSIRVQNFADRYMV